MIKPRIMCAICAKPVDRIERRYDACTNAERYKVWCHGDNDQCEIPAKLMEESLNLGDFMHGTAFVTKRIQATTQQKGD